MKKRIQTKLNQHRKNPHHALQFYQRQNSTVLCFLFFLTWFRNLPVGVFHHTLRSILPLVLPCVLNVLQANPEILRLHTDLLRKQTVEKRLFKPGKEKKRYILSWLKKTNYNPVLPVSNSDVTSILERHLDGANLITGVAVSFPALKNGHW